MISPITKIALRRIKNSLHKNLFLMIAVLFSVMMISFFVFFELQTLITQNPAYQALPFTEFMVNVRTYMSITIVFLILITFVNIRIHCGMRSEENTQALAVLTSVGATGAQKRKLILADIMLLYLPPTVLGILIGMIPGIITGTLFQGVLNITVQALAAYALTAIVITAFAFSLILLCNYLPSIQFRRRSVIQSVRQQNVQASEQRHGYRQSKTYRNQALFKRLAKKSIDYYAKAYHGIALAFASAALYPVLAVLLFVNIGNSDIVIDVNPYDSLDTSGAVFEVVNNMLLFLGGCFVVLTVVGMAQAIMIARMQAATRKKSAHVYLSVGMPQEDISKMIRNELLSVTLRSAVILLFEIVLANACFALAQAG